jgi:hypothetical protein
VHDGIEAEVAGLPFTAARVEHVRSLECFAFRVQAGERSLVYSGDTTLCDGLLRLVPGADALILECSCDGNAVHLSEEAIEEVLRHASPHARTIITHYDRVPALRPAPPRPEALEGPGTLDDPAPSLSQGPDIPHRVEVATDLSRFSFF